VALLCSHLKFATFESLLFESLGSSSPIPDDSVGVMVALMKQLLEFTSWRFGRVQGKTIRFFACAPGGERDVEIKRFFECYARQQRRIDPRAIAIVADTGFPNAVTLTITTPDGNDAMLILLRDDAAGTFTENDYRILAQSKVLCEESLVSSIAGYESSGFEAVLVQRTKPILYILDQTYQIVMGQRIKRDEELATSEFLPAVGDRLPKIFEDAVRVATPIWADNPATSVNVTLMPLPFLSLHIHGMEGNGGYFLAVTIERVRRRNVLLRAAKKYLITPREREVAAFLFDGLRIEEIGERLSISTSTVNDHIKNLIERTGAKNRSQMLALLLGWENRLTKTSK